MILPIVVTRHNCIAVLHHTCNGQQRNMPHKLSMCGMLRLSTYDEAVCVNAAIEINVLDYAV